MRVYGQWAGKPQGTPEDPKRCIAAVMARNHFISHQCPKPRGKGKDELYCGHHAKKYPAMGGEHESK